MPGAYLKKETPNFFKHPKNDIALFNFASRIEEYKNYLNFNIAAQSSESNPLDQSFLIPPPTPVTMAFSHLSLPINHQVPYLQGNDNSDDEKENTPEHVYAQNVFDIWGSGQLGLFTKTPDQLSAPPNVPSVSLTRSSPHKEKIESQPIPMHNHTALQSSCHRVNYASVPPPGFAYVGEHEANMLVNMRRKIRTANRTLSLQ